VFERYGASKRKQLGLAPADPLDPRGLANNLGIRVLTPHEISGLTKKSLQTLLHQDGQSRSCWSAVTLVVGNKAAVILNSFHSLCRQANDLMHELAHRILEHETHEIDVTADGIMVVSGYDKKQEEADWLSSCLLLPREALVVIKRQHMEFLDAAKIYGMQRRSTGCSEDLRSESGPT
jgi:Zn-dependent peptidase ImmA (M78 family)